MSIAATSAPPIAAGRPILVTRAGLQHGLLWVFLFLGSIVEIEPSPYEAMFPIVLVAFIASGLSFHRALAPLALAFACLNVGGLASVQPYIYEPKYVIFTLISIYMALTCLFFAAALLDDTIGRLNAMRSGYVWTAAFASLLGLIGYFDTGVLHDVLTRNERADALFKDPNVFGPFLVLPFVWLVDDFVSGAWTGARRRVTFGAMWSTFVPLLLITIGLFLSMSRGAWGVAVAAVALTIALRFFLVADGRLRRRIVMMTVLALGAAAALLVVALSIPQISELFAQRFSLNQDYDGGTLGRFGGQLRSIPMLLSSPNGFGPLRFPLVVGNEDPHNVYINAFAAYGWLGGVSYWTMAAMTLFVGWRLVLRKGPYRSLALPIWSSCFFHIVQGFQIDTDHWRHYFFLVGLTWGLAAATYRHEARAARGARATSDARPSTPRSAKEARLFPARA